MRISCTLKSPLVLQFPEGGISVIQSLQRSCKFGMAARPPHPHAHPSPHQEIFPFGSLWAGGGGVWLGRGGKGRAFNLFLGAGGQGSAGGLYSDLEKGSVCVRTVGLDSAVSVSSVSKGEECHLGAFGPANQKPALLNLQHLGWLCDL